MDEYDTALGASRIVPVCDPRWHMWRPRYAQPMVLNGCDPVDVDATMNEMDVPDEGPRAIDLMAEVMREKSREALDAMEQFLRDTGAPQTPTRIGRAVNRSPNWIAQAVRANRNRFRHVYRIGRRHYYGLVAVEYPLPRHARME